MLGLAHIHTVIINIFHLFKKLNRDTEEVRKTQNKFLEMKITLRFFLKTPKLDGIGGTLHIAKVEATELEASATEMIKNRRQKAKIWRSKPSTYVSCEFNFQWPNTCVLEVPDEKQRGQGTENIFEKIMTEKLPNVVKTINLRSIQEVQ